MRYYKGMDPKALERILIRETRRWFRRLELHHEYELVIVIQSGEGAKETGPYGACAAKPGYRHAKVYYNLERIPDGEDLELLVVHELTHVVISPLQVAAAECVETGSAADRMLEEHGERVCHDVSRLFLKLKAKRDPHRGVRVQRQAIAAQSSPELGKSSGKIQA